MVVIDTDVLLLDLAYPRDKRFAVNGAFLARITTSDPAVTIYNLMELLGQLSFNLAPTKLAAWQSWLLEAYQLTVIWPVDPSEPAASSFFRAEILLARQSDGMPSRVPSQLNCDAGNSPTAVPSVWRANEIFERPFAKMREQRMAFMDSLILNLAERTPNIEHFITWNAKHFRGKSSLHVLTPEEYMSRAS